MKKIVLILVLFSSYGMLFAWNITIRNNSNFADENIYVQIVTAGRGYWDWDKNQWTSPSADTAAPARTLDQIKKNGLNIPNDSDSDKRGGRIYISIGAPSPVKETAGGGGYQAPLPSEPENLECVFDKIEICTGNGIINQTAVDYVSLPISFQVDGQPLKGYKVDCETLMTGFTNEFPQNDLWKALLKSRDGITYGVLNPANIASNVDLIDQQVKDALHMSDGGAGTTTLHVWMPISGGPAKCVDFTVNRDTQKVEWDDPKYGKTGVNFKDFISYFVLCNHSWIMDPGDADGMCSDPMKPYQGKDSGTWIKAYNNYNPEFNIYGAITGYLLRGTDLTQTDKSCFDDVTKFTYTMSPYAKVVHENSYNNLGYAFGYDDTGTRDFSSSTYREGETGLTIIINDCSYLSPVINK